MNAFFSYFGAKHQHILKYPIPRFRRLIEPFAGSAAYATRYHYLEIELYDIDPLIAALWKYLINVSESEILALPNDFSKKVEPLEAQHLIGFWVQRGSATPCKSNGYLWANNRPDTSWCQNVKERIARNLKLIRHWKIFNKSYSQIDNVEATWFIDPPYESSGKAYRYSFINYNHLAKWCSCRKGEIIVCEQNNANWLPFSGLYRLRDNVELMYYHNA
jgi:site-specific DNA-adenine methylase